jgi:hypothetical protein
MTRSRWAVLAALLAVLAGLQHYGLDPRPEVREEDRLRRLGNLPPGDMVPTYIASLFFGAFRAAAIDVLWIQLRRAEEERRWYEAREILKFISYFQPRNPEVWSNLGWQAAYNIANGFTDPEKSWEWVRFGLTWLRNGIRMLPGHPQLMMELAYTLNHKPSWREARFDGDLMARIEKDRELQADLRPDGAPDPGRPLTAFELAMPWLERSRDLLLADRGPAKTQMGLYIYPSTADGYLQQAHYFQGIYDWRRGKLEDAARSFRAAEDLCRKMLEPGRYPEPISPIYLERAAFYARLPEAVQAVARAESGRPEDLRAAVRLLEEIILPQVYPLDGGFLWNRYQKGATLNELKRRLAGGLDPFESNDSLQTATDLSPGIKAAANLAPEGGDVDFYWMNAPAPPGADPAKPPVPPLRATVTLSRPEGARMDLKLTVLGPDAQPLKTEEFTGPPKVVVLNLPLYGLYRIKVEALRPAGPWPADTRYELRTEIR